MGPSRKDKKRILIDFLRRPAYRQKAATLVVHLGCVQPRAHCKTHNCSDWTVIPAVGDAATRYHGIGAKGAPCYGTLAS